MSSEKIYCLCCGAEVKDFTSLSNIGYCKCCEEDYINDQEQDEE